MYNHWALVVLNTFVHIFVYGYFAANTLKIPVPWKSAITILQISQFVIDMAFALPFPYMKWNGMTQGDWGPWLIGQFIGVSFVVLFTRVYLLGKKKKVA
jgi:hypothetical protein